MILESHELLNSLSLGGWREKEEEEESVRDLALQRGRTSGIVALVSPIFSECRSNLYPGCMSVLAFLVFFVL